jgi:hypothetical protein
MFFLHIGISIVSVELRAKGNAPADMNLHAFLSKSDGVAVTPLAPMPAKPTIFKNFLLFIGSSPGRWFVATSWRLPVIPADFMRTVARTRKESFQSAHKKGHGHPFHPRIRGFSSRSPKDPFQQMDSMIPVIGARAG